MGTIDAILRAKRAIRSWFTGRVLRDGEFAYETDQKGLKIGDGGTTYASLPYLIPPRHNEHNKYLKVVNGNVIWADGYDDTAIWTAVNSKYTFPAGGIPKTDLSSSVQDSLDLADTAIQDISGKQDIATLDADVAALGFVKNTVNDLLNYYLKTETYTQAEVNALISGMSGFTYEIYASLSDITSPAHNVLYLIGPTGSGSDKYEEYVYPVNDFVKIGDTSIDLSGYVTTSDLNTALADYTTTTDLTMLLAGYQTKIDANNKLDYSLLDNTPAIPSDTSDLTNGAGFITSSDIPSDVSDFNNDAGYITLADVPAQVQSDWNESDTSSPAYIDNKPSIPSAGIPAGGNAGQVLKKTSATDYDVNWANASETLPSAYCTTSGSTAAKKANCSLYVTQANQYLQVLIGSANTYQGALTMNINSAGAKPIYINGTASSSSNYTLPNGTYFVFYDGTNYYFRTDGKLPMKDAAFGGSYNDLADKPTIPAAQVNADWSANSGVAEILNKPTLGTAASLDVPASGDAATTEVVKGDDSRLTDARTPTAHSHTVSEITDFPTLATVATSGDYDDLQNKPTIPAAQVNSDWNASSGVAQILNKPTIPDVSTKYDTGDTAETTLDDADYVPFYDTSASGRRKSLWSNIKAKLKTYFDNYYLTSHQDISGKADKVSGATADDIATLDSSGNPTDSGIAKSSVQSAITNSHTHSNKSLLDTYTQTEVDLADAVSKKHSHSNKTILDMVPSSLGTAGQAIAVNDAGTGLEFKTIGGGGGLTDYDFTHVANTTVSTSTTITFAANTRGSQMVSTSADLAVTFAVNNGSDNYLWIKNTGAADIDITISAVTAGGSPVANIYIPTDGITVATGNVCEIGIIVNADGAFITSRSDLAL